MSRWPSQRIVQVHDVAVDDRVGVGFGVADGANSMSNVVLDPAEKALRRSVVGVVENVAS